MSDDAARRFDIDETLKNPVAGPVSHYEFTEPGTWGTCRGCMFEATLDEDGLVRAHERMTGATTRAPCDGARKEPL